MTSLNQWKRRIMQPETPSKPKGLPGAKVAKAAELVNYQDGSIVSREIVKKPTGNVTIFAFDEGQAVWIAVMTSLNQWKRRIMQPETPSKPKGLPGAKVAKAAEESFGFGWG